MLFWCSRWDLNPHALGHTHLKRTCLPFHHPSLFFWIYPWGTCTPLICRTDFVGCSYSGVWLRCVVHHRDRWTRISAHLPFHHPSQWTEYIQMGRIANKEKKVIIFLCLPYQPRMSSTTSNTPSKNCSQPSSGISYDPLSYSHFCCRSWVLSRS